MPGRLHQDQSVTRSELLSTYIRNDLRGVSESVVPSGQRNITIETVEKLAKALACWMAALMPDAEDG